MKNNIGNLSLVMVAYNEADRIERVIREYYNDVFKLLPEGSEFIIYLDGPTDKTSAIVNGLAQELNLKVIDCPDNKGYFQAVKNALGQAKNENIFFSDSSGKLLAKDFWQLIKKIDDYDIVTGLRTKRTDPLHRRIMSLIGRLFISSLFFMPLYDYNTGFKLIKKNVLDSVLNECHTLPISFSNELIIRAYKKGFKICNVPISFQHRGKKDITFAVPKLPKIITIEFGGLIKLRLELLK